MSDNSDYEDAQYFSCSSFNEESSMDSFCSTSDPSLSETLTSLFSDFPTNFNVIHINAQSIPAHYPDMLASFESNNIHAILVSESWLKPILPSISYSLPGFRLIRNDRQGKGGGGVAIYLRAHIPFQILSMSTQPPPPDSGEHLIIEVGLKHSKLLLGVFYIPSLLIDFFTSFETILEHLVPNYSHSIIMGDFNTCLLKGDHRTKKFHSVIDACNLHVLPLSPTHSIPGFTPSLLDLMIVCSPNSVSKFGQTSADAFSHHDLIFLSYSLRPPKPKPRVLLQRNFKGMDVDKLRADAGNIDWTALYDAETIELKIELLNRFVLRLYDVHAPVKPVKMKHLPAPWLTDELKCLINKKNRAKTHFKRNQSHDSLLKFKSLRNRCNRLCRDAQRRYIHKSVENGDAAKVWKFLNSMGVGKSRNNTNNCNIDIESLNKHFCSSLAIFESSIKTNTLNILSSAKTPVFPPFSFNQFTDCDVMKAIRSIPSNAVGSDSISRNMVIPIVDLISPVLTHLFNFSISSCAFPDIWKDSFIIPLPKKRSPSTFSDYRPISILPFLSKALERLIHDQLHIFLNKYNVLNPFQSGFRQGHSTITALTKITDDIRYAMDHKKITLLALLDFSNAFNTVDFDILLAMLRLNNISPTVIAWFRSYLKGRRQRIRIDDQLSAWCTNTSGVPQGSVLSPLLFSIFINTITNNITSAFHMYADDLQIYRHSSLEDISDAVTKFNEDLARISHWAKSHGLFLNELKTQVIVIGGQSLIGKIHGSSMSSVNLNGTDIPIRHTIKNLGLHFDDTLTWNSHIKEVSRRMFGSVRSLRRLKNLLPIPTKIALAQSLLLPILDYADACYINLTKEQLNKLERLQNICIRFIFGLRKYDHISQFRDKLKWLPIRLRRNTHILRLLYCVLFDPRTPVYLKERFSFTHEPTEEIRTAKSLKLKIPQHTTNFYGSSFSVVAVKLWNNLPLEIREAKNVTAFMTKLKKHYSDK